MAGDKERGLMSTRNVKDCSKTRLVPQLWRSQHVKIVGCQYHEMWSVLIWVKQSNKYSYTSHCTVILFCETCAILPFEKAFATYRTTFFRWLHQSRSCASVITKWTAHRTLSTSSPCWLQHRNDHSCFHCKLTVPELQAFSHPTLMSPLLTGFKWQLICLSTMNKISRTTSWKIFGSFINIFSDLSFEELDVVERIILKWILNKEVGRITASFLWFRRQWNWVKHWIPQNASDVFTSLANELLDKTLFCPAGELSYYFLPLFATPVVNTLAKPL
jgi:hypothetical protein